MILFCRVEALFLTGEGFAFPDSSSLKMVRYPHFIDLEFCYLLVGSYLHDTSSQDITASLNTILPQGSLTPCDSKRQIVLSA